MRSSVPQIIVKPNYDCALYNLQFAISAFSAVNPRIFIRFEVRSPDLLSMLALQEQPMQTVKQLAKQPVR